MDYFTERKLNDAVKDACKKLERMTPGSEEYLRQALSIKALTETLPDDSDD